MIHILTLTNSLISRGLEGCVFKPFFPGGYFETQRGAKKKKKTTQNKIVCFIYRTKFVSLYKLCGCGIPLLTCSALIKRKRKKYHTIPHDPIILPLLVILQ